MFRYFLTYVGCFVILSLYSLKLNAQSIRKQFNNGLDALYTENINEAYLIFDQIKNSKPDYRDLDYYHCLTATLSLVNVETNKDRYLSFEEDNDKYPFYYYWLGRIESETYESEKAIQSFQKFLNNQGYVNPELISETKARIKALKNREELLSNSRLLDIAETITLNTGDDDVSGSFSQSTLVYISGKSTTAVNTEKDLNKIKVEGDFDEIQIIGNRIATRKNNMISIGDFTNGEISNLAPILFDDSGIIYSFYISEQLDYLYLSLDTKKYGADLFYAEKGEDEVWSFPELLASESINTSYNETTPYFDSQTGTLYFSSDRPDQIGNYDVFSSKKTSKGWETPQNLGAPINSPDDDLFFKGSVNNVSILSSSRLGGQGGLDIYVMKPEEQIVLNGQVNLEQSKTNLMSGEVNLSSSSTLFPDTVTAEIINGSFTANLDPSLTYEMNILTNGRTVLNRTFSVKQGVNYPKEINETFYVQEIDTENDREIPDKPASSTLVQNEKPDKRNVENNIERAISYPQSISPGTSPIDNTTYFEKKKAIARNVYFSFDQHDIRSSELSTLNQVLDLMKKQKTMKLEIAGHTDIVGPTQTNQRISELRALQVREWLVDKGIQPNRLLIKGYSESIPMASNNFEREGREFNRRVEFLVIN
ncbi:MAG: OmpA family protein [Cyclobacteriaceae bacterium]